MEDLKLLIDYTIWIVIIGLTIGFFSYFSKKHSSLGTLLLLVLIPTWVIVTILKIFERMYFENAPDIFSINEFAGMLAETLPMLILFGGITFTIKYLRNRNRSR